MGFSPTQSLIVIKKVPVFKDVSVMYSRTYDMKKGKNCKNRPFHREKMSLAEMPGFIFS